MIQEKYLIERLRARRAKLIDPNLGSAVTASVAIVLIQSNEGVAMLYLVRAQCAEDPWSGQIGFPGGKINISDESPLDAVIRETQEETAIDLKNANLICRLDDETTSINSLHVAAFVFLVSPKVRFQLNSEISAGFWVPLSKLMDENRYIKTIVSSNGNLREVFGVNLLGSNGPVLWGLTYRFTSQVLASIGLHLPGGKVG